LAICSGATAAQDRDKANQCSRPGMPLAAERTQGQGKEREPIPPNHRFNAQNRRLDRGKLNGRQFRTAVFSPLKQPDFRKI